MGEYMLIHMKYVKHMRFKVLTAVKMSMFGLRGCNVVCPDDGGSMFLRNVHIYLQVHTAKREDQHRHVKYNLIIEKPK
jgi:hypothetical protein